MATNPDCEEWIQQDAIVLGWLFASKTYPVFVEVGNLETSNDVWNWLACCLFNTFG